MSPRRARALQGRTDADPATALREHLVGVVMGLLRHHPMSSITTRDIARTAEVSDGVLYNYFGDKTELVMAAVTRRYGELAGAFATSMPAPGEGTVEENLRRCIRAMVDFESEVLPIGAGLVGEPELLHRFLEEIHRPPLGAHVAWQPLTDYLQAEQRLGRLPADLDLDSVATLLIGGASVLAISAQFPFAPARGDVEARTEGVAAALMRGLTSTGTSAPRGTTGAEERPA